MNAPDTCTCPEHGDWMAAAGVKRLVRQLDVALNGEAGASARPALIDVVAQVLKVVRERGAPLLAAATNPPAIGSSVVAGQPPSGGEVRHDVEDVLRQAASLAERINYSANHDQAVTLSAELRQLLKKALSARVGLSLFRTAPPSGGEVWPASVRDEALEVLRNVDAQLGATGQASSRVERLINLIAGLPASAPPSAPVDCIKAVSAIEDALDRAEVPHKDRNGRWLTLVERVNWLIAEPPSAPVGVEGALLERLDAIHRQVFGKSYPTEALAQKPAAVECPHRTRCDCLAACKYGMAGDGALVAQPAGVTQPASGGVSNASLAQPQEPQR